MNSDQDIKHMTFNIQAANILFEASDLGEIDVIEESGERILVFYDSSKREIYSDDHLQKVGEVIKSLQLGKWVTKIEVLTEESSVPRIRVARALLSADLDEICDRFIGL